MNTFTGESEGLEFVFDVCAPSRTVRGPHYAVKREYHKRLFSRYELSQEQVLWPEPAVRDELVRLFFHYVHPFLPVVDPHDFLHKYGQGVNSISRLLLWSIFFAAANFASVDLLRQAQFQSRKTLREYFYQRAKELYDGQDEGEKTTIIQSAILLSFWYVDREEIDGAWHWLGIALSLCHTLGLHRAWSNDAFAQTPFTHSFRTTWKRIWWCCFYREAFAAQGFGRPMRIHIDDCDIDMPTINDVSLSYEVIQHRRRLAVVANISVELSSRIGREIPSTKAGIFSALMARPIATCDTSRKYLSTPLSTQTTSSVSVRDRC